MCSLYLKAPQQRASSFEFLSLQNISSISRPLDVNIILKQLKNSCIYSGGFTRASNFFSVAYVYCAVCSVHRRRIYIEDKAKVVAASWGTELLHLLAALAILHQDDLKNRMNCFLFCINPSSIRVQYHRRDMSFS